jgi:hypothetical protein
VDDVQQQAERIRALARQRDEALAAERDAKQQDEERFRTGVTQFAATAAQRLAAAGVPTIEARLAPVESPPRRPERRSWQRPTFRDRISGAVAALREFGEEPPAPPEQPAPVRGWRMPIIHPVTGARNDHGMSYTHTLYERGDPSGRITGALLVFLGTDGRLSFAGSPTGEDTVYLYPYLPRDTAWIEYAGRDVASVRPRDVVAALGFGQSSAAAWEVGRDQAQIELYEAVEHNKHVADNLVAGWYAALEDLLESYPGE